MRGNRVRGVWPGDESETATVWLVARRPATAPLRAHVVGGVLTPFRHRGGVILNQGDE